MMFFYFFRLLWNLFCFFMESRTFFSKLLYKQEKKNLFQKKGLVRRIL